MRVGAELGAPPARARHALVGQAARGVPGAADLEGLSRAAGSRRSSRPAASRDDYPFWLLTARSMQYAWGANVGMQLIKRGRRQHRRPPRRDHQRATAARSWASPTATAVEIATPTAPRAAAPCCARASGPTRC